MAIPLRKATDIEKLRAAGNAVAKTLDYLEQNVKAGMTLLEVDAMGEKFLRDLGARPAFKGLYGFPNAICTSLNEVASRLTFWGSIYLGMIATVPWLIVKAMGVPFFFGGTAVLIVVQVAIDTMRKIEAQQYNDKYNTLSATGL